METSRAYDLPLRIFHWLFAFLFLTSFSIAKLIDDESIVFVYHMLAGLMMIFIIILRVLWGIFGPKTSRFRSFRLMPTDLIDYLKSATSSRSKRYLGHNPASSYAAVLMFLFAFGLGLSGLMMSLRISKHFFEEVHELLANGFLIIVILHIAGVILHQLKHRDGMIWSMINGKKAKIDDTDELKSNHPLVALVFIALFIFTGNYLYRSFDENTGKINIFGNQVQLGENESRVNSIRSEDTYKDNHYGDDHNEDEDEDDD